MATAKEKKEPLSSYQYITSIHLIVATVLKYLGGLKRKQSTGRSSRWEPGKIQVL